MKTQNIVILLVKPTFDTMSSKIYFKPDDVSANNNNNVDPRNLTLNKIDKTVSVLYKVR